MDYVEDERLEKLKAKCFRDMESEIKTKDLNSREEETKKSIQKNLNRDNSVVSDDKIKSTYQDSYVRWQSEPDLLAIDIKDPCIKRREMAL